MEFKVPYLLAMREQDPKMFMDLRRSGELEAHVQQKAEEASQMLKGLLANVPKSEHGNAGVSDQQAAEEQVLATLIDFPQQKKDQNPEPPDDLPTAPMRQ